MHMLIFLLVYLLIGGVFAFVELLDSGYIEDDSVSIAEKIVVMMLMLTFWLPSLTVELILRIITKLNKKKL